MPGVKEAALGGKEGVNMARTINGEECVYGEGKRKES